jgi:hypothetical protein
VPEGFEKLRERGSGRLVHELAFGIELVRRPGDIQVGQRHQQRTARCKSLAHSRLREARAPATLRCAEDRDRFAGQHIRLAP